MLQATFTKQISRAEAMRSFRRAVEEFGPRTLRQPVRTGPRRVESDLDRADRDLRERQRRHLEGVRDRRPKYHPSQCAHNRCTTCHGTGVDSHGRECVHMISCPCPRCSPCGC